MPRSAPPRADPHARGHFVVYVEGPRDRDVLRCWARRQSPRLARALAPAFVILGGRRPARAVEDLRRRREQHPDTAGLCVLDGDIGAGEPRESEHGLELFTWERRHIESYLLVASAIQRALRVSDQRFDRVLREHLPDPEDEDALRVMDAKRLLGPKGPFARFLGRPVSVGQIARVMRSEELGREVVALLERLEAGLGVTEVASVPSVTRPNGRLRPSPE